MAKQGGRKPDYRFVAVSKERDEETGKRQYDELGAAWESEQVPGSYGVRIKDDGRFRVGGKTYSAETHFFNFEPPLKSKGGAARDAADDSDDGDVSF